MARFRKSDISFHDGRPAVNVKVHFPRSFYDGTMARETESEYGLPGFAAWWDAHADDESFGWLFDAACEGERETFAEWENSGNLDYAPAFPDYSGRLKMYQDGRSGGWLVVEGLPDVESWDAVMVSRWARFARVARSFAQAVPATMMSIAAMNPYAAECDRIAAKRARADERAALAENLAADAMAELAHG